MHACMCITRVHYKHLCWPKPTNYNALFLTSASYEARSYYIYPIWNSVESENSSLQYEILSYHQDFFVDFFGVSDAGRLYSCTA